MSFHVLHLFTHGAWLHKSRGRLVYQSGATEKSLPIENLRAVVVAARGISFSSQLLGALMDQDCVILHCNDKYIPTGITAPLSRTINQKIITGQTNPRGKFIDQCWRRVLAEKLNNQVSSLQLVDNQNTLAASEAIQSQDEARCARIYFRAYFRAMEAYDQNRANKHSGWLNGMLNYGYAVLSSLVHRSITIHGLLPHIGIHHRPRYGAWPLVYDLMEPFRPVVDGLTTVFISGRSTSAQDISMDDYGRFIGSNLRQFRVPHTKYSIKLVDAVDFVVRSFAVACETQSHEALWLPSIETDLYRGVAPYVKAE
jgi:CRISPR-associated protein Cas1